MLSCRPDFPGYIPPPIAVSMAIILFLCNILQGINGNDDTERSVTSYFGLYILVVLGTFQERPHPDELKFAVCAEHNLKKVCGV